MASISGFGSCTFGTLARPLPKVMRQRPRIRSIVGELMIRSFGVNDKHRDVRARMQARQRMLAIDVCCVCIVQLPSCTRSNVLRKKRSSSRLWDAQGELL
jgi:hypothetical protein